MLVSWDWLGQYVKLDMTPAELAERLAMAGLNHEGTTPVDGDQAIHLEVTSNRPDCLGHIGIAREVAVLWNRPLNLPAAKPREGAAKVDSMTSVALESAQLCPRYTARVIRGAKIGPSPPWLAKRLTTVGVKPINNVVDITNYVLLECGQPLHAFDLAKLAGRKIIVREARPGEPFMAINHVRYTLEKGMCVIADAQRPVALGGVMGGAETEVSEATTELLIESAEFDPIATRATARRLTLHSDSSYRFERGVDPAGVDWASRRCCELILDLAGGELAAGAIEVGRKPEPRKAITLRFAQLCRVLGIEIPSAEATRILVALGCDKKSADADRVEVIPPTWRRDLDREIDLVEEVARIHGYDKIPENVSVPMATSRRTDLDRVLAKVRGALTACGLDEAMTLSAVDESWSDAFSPWTDAPALRANTPVLRRADRLRRSLVPSLLGARRTNESLGNPIIEIFETAHVYLPRGAGEMPVEELMLAIASGGDYLALKGIVETIVASLNPAAQVTVAPLPPAVEKQGLLDPDRAAELKLSAEGINGELLGYLGVVSDRGRQKFELRSPVTIAELKISLLTRAARLTPQYRPLPVYPAMARDLNLVVDEAIRWADVAATVRATAGPSAESLDFQDVYHDVERLGQGKKSLLFSLTFRSKDTTLTNEEVDRLREAIVAACKQKHGAELRV